MGWPRFTFLSVVLLFLTGQSYAQSLAEMTKAPLSESEAVEGTFPETIKIISSSKKIFILTNNNQQLGPGDFISLATDNQLAARAVVAKVHEDKVGIKILKIYSLSQWTKLRRGLEVQIIRGDDSSFGKKLATSTTPEVTEEAPKIKSEDDLYNDKAVAEDDDAFDDDSKRHIKPDNVVSLGMGFFTANDIEDQKARATQLSGAWAYQFTDNWFAEFVYARSQLEDYPAKSAVTLVNNVVGRLKFNFKAPLYSFIMPYVGFQSQTISSNAGQSKNAIQDAQEIEVNNKLKKAGPVFGVTLLRRLVPGWFLKADLGTDVLNAGVAIEF